MPTIVEECPVNTSYLAYCRASGKNLEEMMKHDREQYPGGCMTGFILWMSDMKRKFRSASPKSFLHGSLWDYQGFSEFVNKSA